MMQSPEKIFDPCAILKSSGQGGCRGRFPSFSAASMLQHNQPYLATFIGAAAAALEVQIVCNREPVNLGALTSYINTLLK